MKIKCSASLVLYNSPAEMFVPAIKSFLESMDDCFLVVSDNSNIATSHPLFQHPRVKYIFNNSNLGFGAGHNCAIDLIKSISDFHLILNPDICFDKNVLNHLINEMRLNPHIGALMPRINYPDGTLQRLCKLLPTPIDLIVRRFIPCKLTRNLINRRYELYDLPQNHLVEVPVISGCFLLTRTKLLYELGGFDERFFMYLEDVDLVRRIGNVSKVTYDPRVSVTHAYAKGSYKSKKLLMFHIVSAVRYFTKWGWFYDPTRKNRNSAFLRFLKNIVSE